jgi:hypothetical protein
MPHILNRHCEPTGRAIARPMTDPAPPDGWLREAIQSPACQWIASMTRRMITGGQHDRVSDIARIGRPRRHRGVGGIFVSAEIVQFIPRPNHNREPTEFPTIAFRSAAQPDDLTLDHVDTSPSEYVSRHCEEQSDEAIQ